MNPQFNLVTETCIWLSVIWLFIAIHLYIIVKMKKTPYHAVSFACSFIIGYIMSLVTFDSWIFRGVNLLYLGLIYWVLFNLGLNILRGKPPLHLGRASILDRLESRFRNPRAALGMKVIAIIACLFYLLDL